jgi:hypothetical protein
MKENNIILTLVLVVTFIVFWVYAILLMELDARLEEHTTTLQELDYRVELLESK